jgi:hypothetical protein
MISVRKILKNISCEYQYSTASSEFTHHRHVVYCTVKLPNTGPMLNPARRAQIYNEVPKLFARPALQISLTIPDVMFASTPEQAPVMIRVTISVAKFVATT